MEVRDVLLKAAKLVSNGWCQGQSVMPARTGYQYCVIGALFEAAGGTSGVDFDNATDEVSKYLNLPAPYALARWNDDISRLQIEVEDALRETALSLGDDS